MQHCYDCQRRHLLLHKADIKIASSRARPCKITSNTGQPTYKLLQVETDDVK
jgi:hypothetical protein